MERDEFMEFYNSEYSLLGDAERSQFDHFKVKPYAVRVLKIHPPLSGPVNMFVVSESDSGKTVGVIYYNHFEEGFNLGVLDGNGDLPAAGGDQYSLRDAIRTWMPAPKGGWE